MLNVAFPLLQGQENPGSTTDCRRDRSQLCLVMMLSLLEKEGGRRKEA